MNYKEAVQYLNGFINFERVPEPRFDTTLEDLTRFRSLLSELGDPQKRFRIVHIAGTKGKGSTAAILASILTAAGYQTGLYTSPHLISLRERIRIDGAMISKADFAAVIRRIAKAPTARHRGEQLAFRTVFEHLTAAALLRFARSRVDFAVVEAGLGGRLDATVVLDPALSIITPIGLDHTAVLGGTIAEISADKAYIIKAGIPAVSSPQRPEAMAELVKRARTVGTILRIAPGRDEFQVLHSGVMGTRFASSRNWLPGSALKMALPGSFQLANLSTVLTALEGLRELGVELPGTAVEEGIAKVKWRGRLQFRSGTPTIILDGSHNALAMGALTEAIKGLMPNRTWRVVFSAMKDKPIAEMLRILKPQTAKFYLPRLRFPKGVSVTELRETAKSLSADHLTFGTVPEALEAARRDAAPGELVLATGSFYLVGEVMRHLHRLDPPPPDGLLDWKL